MYAAEPLAALVDGLSYAIGGAYVEEPTGTMENIDLTCGECATVVTVTLIVDDLGDYVVEFVFSVPGMCNGATKCRNCELFIMTDLRSTTDPKDDDEASVVVEVCDED